VQADNFEGAGEAGKGLTSGRFGGNVQFQERAHGQKSARAARSEALQIGLSGDVVTQAVFTGTVRFTEDDLAATAAQANYNPAAGTLVMAGSTGGAAPRVADSQIQIEASSITVTLAGPGIVATGGVKTVLQPRDPKGAGQANRLPRLLEQSNPVNVNANALDYSGPSGRAVYTGAATLWQGETAIRADVLTLDRTRGDLVATGAARSTLVFSTGASVGRGPEIRYDDARRLITYGRPVTGASTAPPGAPVPPSQVSGPQGDLRGGRIEIVLAQNQSQIDRLEAYTDVNVRLDTRVATGDRLTYHAEDERYVITGLPTIPVKIIEECRETVGRTVTFFKTADRIIVDGNEEIRTRSSRGGPCLQQAPAR
jgi:lipopolysaccharide export system protein LptA